MALSCLLVRRHPVEVRRPLHCVSTTSSRCAFQDRPRKSPPEKFRRAPGPPRSRQRPASSTAQYRNEESYRPIGPVGHQHEVGPPVLSRPIGRPVQVRPPLRRIDSASVAECGSPATTTDGKKGLDRPYRDRRRSGGSRPRPTIRSFPGNHELRCRMGSTVAAVPVCLPRLIVHSARPGEKKLSLQLSNAAPVRVRFRSRRRRWRNLPPHSCSTAFASNSCGKFRIGIGRQRHGADVGRGLYLVKGLVGRN